MCLFSHNIHFYFLYFFSVDVMLCRTYFYQKYYSFSNLSLFPLDILLSTVHSLLASGRVCWRWWWQGKAPRTVPPSSPHCTSHRTPPAPRPRWSSSSRTCSRPSRTCSPKSHKHRCRSSRARKGEEAPPTDEKGMDLPSSHIYIVYIYTTSRVNQRDYHSVQNNECMMQGGGVDDHIPRWRFSLLIPNVMY